MADKTRKSVRGWPRHRAAVYEHVYSSPDREVGGVLVGELLSDKSLAITGVIPALNAVGKAAEVTFTHESWESIHRELDDRYPGKQIVGWYHSHPSFGIFLSDQDLFIHENFFSKWWQVAVVIDPIQNEEGFFFWKSGKVTQAVKRPVSLKDVPEDLPPRAEPTQTEVPTAPANTSRSEPTNLTAWVLPVIVGSILGFVGAPAIGVGDTNEPVSPTSVNEQQETPDNTTPENTSDAESAQDASPKPTPEDCRAFTLETGELLDGCPLNTLPQ